MIDHMNDNELIYLAGPYTHARAEVRLARFESLTRAAAMLVRMGRIVYSPITMTHPIDLVLAGECATLGSAFWVAFDERFMRCCTEMIVLRLQGWELSSGVTREIEFFKSQGLPIRFIDPDGEEVPDVPI